jgi:uncharacterized protein (DUF427 family)
LRDPYCRIDVRATSRHVQVVAGDEVIAESRRAMVLSETGLPNRFYLPPDDVHRDLLEPSGTHTVCAYKGTTSYHSLHTPSGLTLDPAWYYPEPIGRDTSDPGLPVLYRRQGRDQGERRAPATLVINLSVQPIMVGALEQFNAELGAHHWPGRRLSGLLP